MNSDQGSSKKEHKIAVIGPTQAGKTCLALGLFSTSTSGFTIETVGQGSREYLDGLKADIARRKWPDPSSRGTKKNIRFEFRKKGKDPCRVGFPDYDGERLRTDEEFTKFANENFKDLDGVVLLLNPGADPFQLNDPSLLADLMSQYKRVLSFLHDPNNGSQDAIVALTVTAADRINGDLKGKLEAFDQSVKEISNTLGSSGFDWKRFDVTITGHLKEQNDPELARDKDNSASAPFLWILDKLNWRTIGPGVIKKILRVSYVAMALVGIAAIWTGVSVWNDSDKIDGIERECRLAMKGCHERNKPRPDDLKTIRDCLSGLRSLRTTFGFLDEKSAKLADALEPEAWQLHEMLINVEIDAIAKDPEKYGGDCQRVDKIFTDFVPKVKSLADEQLAKKGEWAKRKPGILDRYASAQLAEKVGRPLGEMVSTHGKAAFEKFVGLYAELRNVEVVGNSIARRAELCSNLDARVEREWRDFEIPDFKRNAKSKASDKAVSDLVVRLKEWEPFTSNAFLAKDELLAVVTNAVPAWRTAYEKSQLEDSSKEAVDSRDMAKMAKFFPERVATNEFLSLEFVESIWNNRVHGEYRNAYENYKASVVAKVRGRSGRPKLTDDDKARIVELQRTIGQPFSSEAAIAEIQAVVAVDQEKWDSVHRKKCEDWISENITKRPNRDRTGSEGLFDAYVTERRRCRDYEEVFNEIVRSAVYRQAEKWLESDFEFFRAGKGDVKSLFLEKFKPLCLRICEDKANHDPKSWAYPFAVKCVDVGRIKENGFDNVFPQVFELTEVKGRIQCVAGTPRKDLLGTQIGVSVCGEELFPCEEKDEGRRLASDGTYKTLWSGGREIYGYLFGYPVFQVKYEMVIDWGRNLTGSDSFRIRSFDEDMSGPCFHEWALEDEKGARFTGNVSVFLKRKSGKTIGELMAEAKKETSLGQK